MILRSFLKISLWIFLLNFLTITVGQEPEPEVEPVPEKFCRYRDVLFPADQLFSVQADWGCYFFNSISLFPNGRLVEYGMTLQINDIDYRINAININNSLVPFHHGRSDVQEAVLHSMNYNPTIYQRWVDCYEDALSCCNNHLLTDVEEDDGKCPPVWDGWTCYYDNYEPGTIVEKVCPIHAYTGQQPRCLHHSQKECFANGTWNTVTNTAPCSKTPLLYIRTRWHIAMLSISLAVCIPCIFILSVYKDLRTQKHSLIRNLIIAIVVRNMIVLMIKNMIVLNELDETDINLTVMAQNRWPCKTLTFFEKLSSNAVFTCMLLEGIYLHQLLTNAFRARNGVNMLWYYVAGGVISLSTAVTWASVMSVHSDTLCWMVTDDVSYQWINDSPRLLMLAINTILLTHIVVILWKTFKRSNNEDKHNIRTAKSALICLPLFGIPFFFVVVRPDTDSCGWEQTYYFVSYALEGLQGVFIAIFHCYIDANVIKNLKSSYYHILRRLNIETKKPRTTEIDRRTTFSTFADTRAYDADSITSNSVQQPPETSNGQQRKLEPTNYEPNNWVNNNDADEDGQTNSDKRKSVVHFNEIGGNDESRI